MTPLQLGVLILWLTMWPHVIFMVLFWQNRFLHPINGRHPKITVLSNLSTVAYATLQWAMITFDLPCQVSKWLQFFVITVSQLCINYRLTQLLFSYEITRNISELKDHKNITEWKPNWFTRHRDWAQKKFMIRVVLSQYIFYLFCFIVITAAYPTVHYSPCNKPFDTALLYLLIGSTTIGFLYSFGMAIKMWKYPNDAFGIKAEFKLYAATPFGLLIMFGVLRGFIPNIGDFLPVFLLSVMNILPMVSIAYPYYQSWKLAKIGGPVKEEELHLKKFLTRPEGIRAFLDYLKLEFSSENLLFWLEVQNFKKILKTSSRGKDDVAQFLQAQMAASQIYEKFFRPGVAPCLLNLPHEMSVSTCQAVQALLRTNSGLGSSDLQSTSNNDTTTNGPSSPSGPLNMASSSNGASSALNLAVDRDQNIFQIFDRAEEEIYRLMAADSWYRFQRTTQFETVKSIYRNNPSRHSGKEILQVVTDSITTAREKKIHVDDELELSTSAHFTLLQNRTIPSSPSTDLDDTISSKSKEGGGGGGGHHHLLNLDPLRLTDFSATESPASPPQPSRVINEPIDRLA